MSLDPSRGIYQSPTSFVLGFHGCDRSVGEAILHGEIVDLVPSINDYDWLGNGIYFWEWNPGRALEFAMERYSGGLNSKGDIKEPFALGAVIDLGFCLDLHSSGALKEVKEAYDALLSLGDPPANDEQLKVRRLDCAVFNFVHVRREDAAVRPYETVRATYREGQPLYPGTDLNHQDHTQICVRDRSILGYFRPVRRSS